MSQQSEARYWLNPIIDEIVETYPEGEIVISSGISPSASYHMGHFREILTADLIRWGLEQRGRRVRHIHVVDNFDPLRKRYDFLPEEFEKYVGWPVCMVPDPKGDMASYADRFFSEFYDSVQKLNIEVEVMKSYEDLYKTGRMASAIEDAVAGGEKIRQIFKEVSNRDLPDDWVPLQILSDNKSYNEWRFKSLDPDKKEIEYTDQDGNTGRMPYNDGRVKLNWRLDWPARWRELGVMVEPHGFQEHGAAGGSFETGKRFAKEVFGVEGPIAGIQYGNVHLIGDTKKMSSSLGNLLTPAQAFELMPPEMVRYIYARYQGKKRIDFDPGLGFMRIMDEFSSIDESIRNKEENEFINPYKFAVDGQKADSMSSLPFNHLVTVYQSSRCDEQKTIESLKRSEGEEVVNEQIDAIKREIGYVRNWLNNWAPEQAKFEVQEKLPEVELSGEQKQLLSELAGAISNTSDYSGQWYHDQIHQTREKLELKPTDAFKAIYRVVLNKDFGPKAGWFLSTLDPEWLVARFKLES